jgi:hypothetical protein
MRIVAFVPLALAAIWGLVPLLGAGAPPGRSDAEPHRLERAVQDAHREAPSSSGTLFVHWFLLQPGDSWAWVIIGGYETRQECEIARERHPLGHWLICARNERNRQSGLETRGDALPSVAPPASRPRGTRPGPPS